jgi:phage tail sheath protein FI
MVFEPNNAATWEKVGTAVDNYLRGLWRAGALLGNTENEAWFFQVGAPLTMNKDDIRDGKLIVKAGLAAIRPAEFIMLELSQQIAQN